ncbi:hypothetical protein [Serinibacter salmoneus]|uniref:hypothetical protein n=1 Tax=Serinibacter salmoneus TaxID=556530 RepID=UPI001179F8EF|nr:hypothetical protein [Serinibacter salmoneus]
MSESGGWGEAARPRRESANGAPTGPSLPCDPVPTAQPGLVEEVIAALRAAPGIVWGRGAALVAGLLVVETVLALRLAGAPLGRLRTALGGDLATNAGAVLAPALGWALTATTAIVSLTLVTVAIARPLGTRTGWPVPPREHPAGRLRTRIGLAVLASLTSLTLLTVPAAMPLALAGRTGWAAAAALGLVLSVLAVAGAVVLLPALALAVPAGSLRVGWTLAHGHRWWGVGVALLAGIALSVVSAAISAPIALLGTALGEQGVPVVAALGSLAGSITTVPVAGVVLLAAHARLASPARPGTPAAP